MPPKIVIKDKHITKEVEIPSRIGDRADKLFDIYKKNADQLALRLAQDMVYYYGQAKKFERLSKEQSMSHLIEGQKVFINQRLEVIDGTFDVWIYLRETMVDWLFEIFVRSADRAAQRKMYWLVTQEFVRIVQMQHGRHQAYQQRCVCYADQRLCQTQKLDT